MSYKENVFFNAYFLIFTANNSILSLPSRLLDSSPNLLDLGKCGSV